MKRILLLCLAFSVLWAPSALAQRTVSGAVTSAEDGSVIPGVNVVLKGTTVGSTTDLDGKFRLSVPEDGGTLVFSFIGMATQEIVVGSRSVIDVSMQADYQELTEVVVTALGVTREKKALGYSVQEVDSKQLADAAEPNVVNALQGQVAGVQIQGTNGNLGGSTRITVRGSNSFLGENQPLFVVDGMPINNDNYANATQQRGFGGYDYGNAASDINPQDIASMSVLKGAAATALYGSRGANGVILITTKSGRAAKKGIGVEFNSNVTFDNAINMIEHQQKYGGGAIVETNSGFVEFIENGTTYYAPVYSKDGAWGPRYDPNRMVRHWDSWDPQSPNYGEVRPWVAPANGYEEFFETGVTLQNSVAFNGANENGGFRLAYTNLDQKGTMPNSNLARNTFSLNANYKLAPKLTITGSANVVKQAANGRNATGYANNNPMQGFTQWWQTQLDVERLKNYKMTDGTQYTWNPGGVITNANNELIGFDAAPYFFDNPYFVRYEFLQEDSRDRFFGNIALNYELAKGLTFSARAMTDGFTFQSREGIPLGSVDQSRYAETLRTFTESNYEAKLLYQTKITQNIGLNAMLGGNLMAQDRHAMAANTNGGLALEGFFNIGNGIGNPTVTTNTQRKKINSVFGMASLDFYSMVFLDLTVRNDWSSTLPINSNSYFYPAVTTSFVFSELPALQNSNVFSFGKLRMGYGFAGNDTDPYRLANVYSPVAPNFGTNPRYTVPNVRNNPNLVNELTEEFEVGLEMAFWKGRLSFELAYYDRITSNQIFSVASSAATGFTSRVVNAGTMKNSGVELMLRGTAVKTKDFAWDINLNFATYNNEVVDLAPGVNNIIMGTTWAADVRLQKGDPYMALYGQDFQRNSNGEVIVGANGIPLAEPARKFLGSAIADYTGGIRNTFTYKGVGLSTLIDFQKGGIIHSTSLQWAAYSGMLPVTAEGSIRENGMIVDGVTETGERNTVSVDPQVYYQSIWSVAAPNVYSASFIKFREARISYTLPASMMGSLPFRDVTFAVFGRNLGLLHSEIPYLDPQVITGTGNIQGLENAQVPPTRSIGFNISFKL